MIALTKDIQPTKSDIFKIVERHRYKKVDGVYTIFETTELKFQPWIYKKEDSQLYIDKIQSYLTPDLVESRYQKRNETNKLFGHCYHATQLLSFLLDKELDAYSGQDENGELHWWLQDGEHIIDVTKEQYDIFGISPPYDNGKKTPWYGWKQRPHKKTLKLLQSITDVAVTTKRIETCSKNTTALDI